jgi:hypothetical protein
LTKAKVLKLARDVEKEILGVEGPRPLLAIPHLLSDSSCCSYYGYLLAHMAVYQTRSYFLEKYGYLADNDKIGPELTKGYWNPGNSLSHKETIYQLTGKKLSGRELAANCNLSTDELWAYSKQSIENARKRGAAPIAEGLNASIRVMHGDELIASNQNSDAQLLKSFENWIEERYSSNA